MKKTPINRALLIIDMQKGSFLSETPRYDTANVVDSIDALADEFRAQDQPVIFVQHDGTAENTFLPQSKDWELLDTLQVKESDILIGKTANDAFYRSGLEAFLKKNEINELWITGCATDFCVEATIQSALHKDYDVIVIANGHTTADRPHLCAEQVIAHYNWVWANMIPTSGSISVKVYPQQETTQSL